MGPENITYCTKSYSSPATNSNIRYYKNTEYKYVINSKVVYLILEGDNKNGIGKYHQIGNDNFYKHFLTNQEYRKMKLKKLETV